MGSGWLLEPTRAVQQTETPCKQGAAYPPQLTRASEHAMAGGAAANRIGPVPCWARPARVVVGTEAVPAPATPLLVWPQCPDPRPGWRVSIRPQPTRAPQGEAMALGPPRGRGPARAVARGPTLQWGAGGTTGGAAAALDGCCYLHHIRCEHRRSCGPTENTVSIDTASHLYLPAARV